MMKNILFSLLIWIVSLCITAASYIDFKRNKDLANKWLKSSQIILWTNIFFFIINSLVLYLNLK